MLNPAAFRLGLPHGEWARDRLEDPTPTVSHGGPAAEPLVRTHVRMRRETSRRDGPAKVPIHHWKHTCAKFGGSLLFAGLLVLAGCGLPHYGSHGAIACSWQVWTRDHEVLVTEYALGAACDTLLKQHDRTPPKDEPLPE